MKTHICEFSANDCGSEENRIQAGEQKQQRLWFRHRRCVSEFIYQNVLH